MKLLFTALFTALTVFAYAQYNGTGSVTQGPAATVVSNMYTCTGGRVTNVGTITASDNTVWTVPAAVNFQSSTFPFASDLYNPCTGPLYANTAAALAALTGSDIISIDTDGELITAFVFADNYFEMYINGTAVGKDDVPFTQFNSNIIRFRVKRPFTIAMHLVDWEENLGLGSENNNGFSYHPGDGGMVAVFKDASGNIIAKTGSDWKAQTFYTAPITDLACPTETGALRSSSACSTVDSNNGSQYYGLHWALPTNWMDAAYNDADWPNANTFTNAEIGVNNKPAYTNFTDIFDAPAKDAEFIWSSNVILDNEVIVRYKVLAASIPSDKSLLQPIELIPNPASKFVDIRAAADMKPGSIEIFNTLGDCVYTSVGSETRIDTSTWPSGCYVVKYTSSNGSQFRKLIIQSN